MKSKFLGLLAAVAALLAGAAGPAQADNLRTSFTTNPQSWTGNLPQYVRLAEPSGFILGFTNPLAGLVAVTYTAECQLIAATSSYLAIGILIDETVVLPTSGDAAFCSGRGAGIGGGLSRYSITVVKYLAAGNHAVTVSARVAGPHTGARLDDTTILIAR